MIELISASTSELGDLSPEHGLTMAERTWIGAWQL